MGFHFIPLFSHGSHPIKGGGKHWEMVKWVISSCISPLVAVYINDSYDRGNSFKLYGEMTQWGISKIYTACSSLPPRSLMALQPKCTKGTVLTWMNRAFSQQTVCSLLCRRQFGLIFHISILLVSSSCHWLYKCWNIFSLLQPPIVEDAMGPVYAYITRLDLQAALWGCTVAQWWFS